MLLFAAHDPGARNHVRPIFEHALRLGESAEFLDLSTRVELMNYDEALKLIGTVQPELLIFGCSMNQGELPLVRACRSLGIRAAAMVDIGAEGKLDPIPPEDFPERFMVTNPGTRDELIEYGARPDTVAITGSAHFEVLSNQSHNSTDVATPVYGLPSNDNLVAFFCSPDTDKSIEAVVSLATLLPTTQMGHPEIFVRPHPRAAHKDKLEMVCGQYEYVHYDGGDQVTGADLLVASRFSLSMASTVSIESLILGTHSAFYQIGWDYLDLDQLYRNIHGIKRIRSEEDLRAFVDSALRKQVPNDFDDLEYYQGALGRVWQAIGELRGQPQN